MFWVYILQNPAGKLYVGHTDDLQQRLHSHNRTDKNFGKFTRKNGPWELVWSEEHSTRALAMERERQIKAMKSARWIRDNLLNGSDTWGGDQDLYREVEQLLKTYEHLRDFLEEPPPAGR